MALDIEDILQDALEFLDPDADHEASRRDDGVVRYGPIELSVAPKVRETTLHSIAVPLIIYSFVDVSRLCDVGR
jgi:hypothetical protein